MNGHYGGFGNDSSSSIVEGDSVFVVMGPSTIPSLQIRYILQYYINVRRHYIIILMSSIHDMAEYIIYLYYSII